jgi:hypothetical protein
MSEMMDRRKALLQMGKVVGVGALASGLGGVGGFLVGETLDNKYRQALSEKEGLLQEAIAKLGQMGIDTTNLSTQNSELNNKLAMCNDQLNQPTPAPSLPEATQTLEITETPEPTSIIDNETLHAKWLYGALLERGIVFKGEYDEDGNPVVEVEADFGYGKETRKLRVGNLDKPFWIVVESGGCIYYTPVIKLSLIGLTREECEEVEMTAGEGNKENGVTTTTGDVKSEGGDAAEYEGTTILPDGQTGANNENFGSGGH